MGILLLYIDIMNLRAVLDWQLDIIVSQLKWIDVIVS